MPTLVLLPGLDGTGQLFQDFVAALGAEVEVVVAAYPANVSLGYAELEDIARSFLPQDRPYYLLAESFSGPIAIGIAASAPPGLRGLVLCCSFARNPLPMLAPLRFVAGAVPVAALPTALLGFFLLGRFATPAHRQALAQTLALVSPAVLQARVRAALGVDRSPLAARIKVPLLYLRARDDRVVPRSASELIVSLAPQTRVVEFPAPHFLLQTLPSSAASAVVEFMDAEFGNGID